MNIRKSLLPGTAYPLLAIVMHILSFNLQAGTGYKDLSEAIPKFWGVSDKELYPEKWEAFWIWRKGESSGTDLILNARKKIWLENVPESAKLFITADSYYELYVNGVFVNRGPARSQPDKQSYDVLDIASLLKAGDNVIAIRAIHQGRYGAFNLPPRPGLLCQLELWNGTALHIVKTDKSWKVRQPEGTSLTSETYGEIVDFRKEDLAWKEIDFDDTQWAQAEELVSDKFWPWPASSPKARPTPNVFPWAELVPRDIPYLKESVVKAEQVFENGEILELNFNDIIAEGAHGLIFPNTGAQPAGLQAYKKGEGPIVVNNRYPEHLFSPEGIYSSYLIFDLGEVMHGYTRLRIEGAPGAIVETIYSTHLLNGKFPLRTEISGRPLTDRIILGPGVTEWDAIELKYMRYIFLVVRNTDQPVKISFAGLTKSDYPFEPKGSFITRGGDQKLDRLWTNSVNTLRAVTTDAFTDNYRERIQYSQTSYYAARASYAAFGDSHLQRRYLKQVADVQQRDGVFPASAPVTNYRGGRFLDGTLFWILGLHDYFLHSGDTLTTRELAPAAEKALERFRTWENDEGFIYSPPYPFWIDHAYLERHGANFSLNALYLLAMENFTSTLEWLGDIDKAKVFKSRSEQLRMAMQEKFWNPDHRLFSDTWTEEGLSEKFSEHAASLAIVAGIASEEQKGEIIKEMIGNRSSRLIPAVLFMHYVAEALFVTGNGEEALKILKERYEGMMRDNGTTLWEEWSLTASKRYGAFRPESNRTNTQAENTFLSYSLSRWLLGIQPKKPGMTELELRFHAAGIPEVKGAMPTPHGIVSVGWKHSKSEIRIEVDIPEGVRALVNVDGLNLEKKIIRIDGKEKALDRNNSEIPEGRHLVELY